MYILIDIRHNKAFYSVRIGGFKHITGKCTRTIKTWLNDPDKANKSGFALYEGQRITTRRGAKIG